MISVGIEIQPSVAEIEEGSLRAGYDVHQDSHDAQDDLHADQDDNDRL